MSAVDSVERADIDNYPEIFWFIVYSSSTTLTAAIFLSVAMSLHALMLINYLGQLLLRLPLLVLMVLSDAATKARIRCKRLWQNDYRWANMHENLFKFRHKGVFICGKKPKLSDPRKWTTCVLGSYKHNRW